MNTEVIITLQNQFDALAHTIDSEEIEFWFAREIQEPLGYSRWENFQSVIAKAIESCKNAGFEPNDHFRGVTKMVSPMHRAPRLPRSLVIEQFSA